VHARNERRAVAAGRGIALALLWLAVLVVAGWAIAHARLSGDLRKFMPTRARPNRSC
jgi:predicted exporter